MADSGFRPHPLERGLDRAVKQHLRLNRRAHKALSDQLRIDWRRYL